MVELLSINEYLVLSVALGLAVYWDMTRGKIPNWLTVSTTTIGIVIHFFDGIEAVKHSLQGFGIGLLVGVVFWLLSVFRAGDSKLLAALGTIVGGRWIISCFLWSVVLGAVLGLFFLMRKRQLRSRMNYLWQHILSCLLTVKWESYQPMKGTEHEFPFAIFLAAGIVLSGFFPLI